MAETKDFLIERPEHPIGRMIVRQCSPNAEVILQYASTGYDWTRIETTATRWPATDGRQSVFIVPKEQLKGNQKYARVLIKEPGEADKTLPIEEYH